jgi:hypothetical protein
MELQIGLILKNVLYLVILLKHSKLMEVGHRILLSLYKILKTMEIKCIKILSQKIFPTKL